MQLRLSASGRTAQQPKSYCTTLPCSKAQARYLSQNIGIDSNCKTLHAKENYKVVCRVLMHHRAEDAYALMSAHNVHKFYLYRNFYVVVNLCIYVYIRINRVFCTFVVYVYIYIYIYLICLFNCFLITYLFMCIFFQYVCRHNN